jgi:hypothetical protein
MPGGWIAVLVLCVLLVASAYLVYEGWTAHSGGIELPDWATRSWASASSSAW